jgi:hypothetical protein
MIFTTYWMPLAHNEVEVPVAAAVGEGV